MLDISESCGSLSLVLRLVFTFGGKLMMTMTLNEKLATTLLLVTVTVMLVLMILFLLVMLMMVILLVDMLMLVIQMVVILLMLMMLTLLAMLMLVKEMLQVLESPSYPPCFSRLAEKCKYALSITLNRLLNPQQQQEYLSRRISNGFKL